MQKKAPKKKQKKSTKKKKKTKLSAIVGNMGLLHPQKKEQTLKSAHRTPGFFTLPLRIPRPATRRVGMV